MISVGQYVRERVIASGEPTDNVFVGRLPDGVPNCIAVYDYAADNSDPKYALESSHVQFACRHQEGNTGYNWLSQIRKEFLGTTNGTDSDGNLYIGFWGVSDIMFTGIDDSERYLHVFNMRVTRELNANDRGHRRPLKL